jgi:vancomycin permeability regulator SanA
MRPVQALRGVRARLSPRSPRSRRRLGRLRVPRTVRGRRRLVRWTVALCVLALLPATWLRLAEGGRVRTEADVPAEPVAVVFGAGLYDGRPSPYLAHRLDAAARLYRAGKVKVLLVTGDNSRTSYDEPDAMRAYLTGHGVPRGQVVVDYAGFDTWDSCSRAKRIFGVDHAVLVSQGFHIRRALALCAAAGIDAYGVGVDEPHDVTWYAGGAREVLAAGKAAVDVAVRPDPRFLGPHEAGVARALSAPAGASPGR